MKQRHLFFLFAILFVGFTHAQEIGIVGPAANGWPSDGNPTDIMLTNNGDGTYSIDALTLTTGPAKFREDQAWTVSYGGDTFPSGPITNGDIPVQAGVYDIVLDLNNNTYTFTDVGSFTEIELSGSAVVGSNPQMATVDGENYELTVTEFLDGDLVFQEVGTSNTFGAASFPSGTATAGGANIPVDAGFYEVTFNLNTGNYSFNIPDVGLVGPGISQWPDDNNPTPDVLMNSTDGNIYTLSNQDLVDGEVKFRQNQSWDLNWGSTDFPSGSLVPGGPDNIPATAGTYDITFNRSALTFEFEQVTSANGTALITGYIDSTCSGADGRTVEIYVDGTVDFSSGWTLQRQANGGGFTTNIDISGFGSVTDSFVYVTNDASTLDAEFSINTNVIENGSISSNGDDAFQLSDDADTVIDRFGEDGVDGTGTAWEHENTYVYRNDGSMPNNGSFDASNWTFGALDLLNNEGSCNGGNPFSDTVPFGSFSMNASSTAQVQIIHNAADPAAQFVDVYLNGNLIADNFEFRNATAFLDVPAETPIDIDVAPENSTDVSESIYNLNTTLTADETYIAVANGVIDPTQFDASVNTIDFGIDVFAGAQQTSTVAGDTSLLVHHGSTDAPTIDAVETSVPVGNIVDDLAYTEFQGYLDVLTQDYVINIETADNSAVVATYEVPLQTLGLSDQAISVLASGFLDPAANQNGPAFGLWVALPAGGPLVELPLVEPEPMMPAPDPIEQSSDVISLFSNVYTNVPVDTWLTSWSSAQLADIQIQGNDTKLYTDLDFAGAETVANPIDATNMDFFHIDVWTPNATTFRVKLVDLGGAPVEGEIAFDIVQEQWVSLQIPLNDFADPNEVTDPNNLLTVRNSIQQVIISGLPAGAVTAYVDNVYFSTEEISTTQFNDDNFNFYPNPVVNTLNLNTSGVVENIKLYNVLGQEVMNVNPEVQSPQIKMGGLKAGVYMMSITIDGVSQSFRVIKK